MTLLCAGLGLGWAIKEPSQYDESSAETPGTRGERKGVRNGKTFEVCLKTGQAGAEGEKFH